MMCTGSLVTRDVVLTAAHCFDDLVGKVVVAFTTDPECDKVKHTLQVVVPAAGQRPQAYRPGGFSLSDVALLRLPQDAPAWTNVMPLNFSPTAVDATSSVYAAGFGKAAGHDQEETLNPMLRYTTLPIAQQLDNEAIVYLKGKLGNDTVFDFGPSPLWFTDDSHGHAICSGDSGGPLVMNDHGFISQVGVASFTFATGGHDSCAGFGAYLKIGTQRDWLRATFNSLNSAYPNPF